MPLSINELAQIRQTVTGILDELQLDAYLFEVEPQEGQWEIKVECAIAEGWETVRLTAKKEYLQRGSDDAVIHELLLDEWREALSACKLKHT
jgi:hypothetical protein